MKIEPVTLAGRHARLEPLALAHLEALGAVSLDPDIWRWMPAPVTNRDELRAYIEEALRGQQAGTALPFATVTQAGNQVVGCTRYGNIDGNHRRVEIGWTWVARLWQRTAINTEVKYLMLRHAFESLGCIRVELKTDALNERSRAAILRLGAREEGTLRQHFIVAGGRRRDTVYYSILDREWPEVKARLEARLARPA